MSSSGAVLHCFAYGEHIDALSGRSLGYRLLAPAEPEAWCGEVEALARRLQAAPYPDHWPATDLFCSVLLADGRRLVAVARYGLVDHTPDRRRGGLELIGAVAPAALSVPAALAVYRWLQKRRGESDDLPRLGGHFALTDVMTAVPPVPPPADPVPVLPVRLWQEGALLFAATTPAEPDHRVSLLEQGAGGTWQWLPLVGADFPLQSYAQRGPLVAWTPHLAGVAVKLDQRAAGGEERPRRRGGCLPAAVGVLLLAMIAVLAANLWATLALRNRVAELRTEAPNPPPTVGASRNGGKQPAQSEGDARERFADALYALLAEQGGEPEWDQLQDVLLARYDRAARQHKELRLKDGDVKGRAAVGAVSLLSDRSARRIEDTMRKALTQRGYDRELIDLACQRVREQLIADAKKGP